MSTFEYLVVSFKKLFPEIKTQGIPSCHADRTPVIVLVEAQPVETKHADILSLDWA